MPGQAVAQLLHQFEKWRPIEVADAVRELPAKRRHEVIAALDNDRLADILQELPEDEQAELLMQLGDARAADVLEEMDPDDAADLLGVLNPTDAEMLLTRMDPGDSAPVRRLLTHSPDTAGGLMTSNPVVLTPDTAVAEALARVRDPDLTTALSSMVFVVRPPTATPTGRYLGCVPLQRLQERRRRFRAQSSRLERRPFAMLALRHGGRAEMCRRDGQRPRDRERRQHQQCRGSSRAEPAAQSEQHATSRAAAPRRGRSRRASPK